jgi:RNA polymerase sigma-70 factor (ECF subfamily)
MVSQQKSDELDQALQRLVAETRQGQAASYKKLLETLAPIVRRNATSLLARCGQIAMAEDVTQDVLIAIHLKLHTYEEGLPFVAWLWVVIRHKVIDALRRNKLPVSSMEEMEFIEPADPEDFEATQSARYDLQKLLSQLKPPVGEIIHALKIEGVTIHELATRYKMTESNIKVIVHRGLQKLSALIAHQKAM